MIGRVSNSICYHILGLWGAAKGLRFYIMIKYNRFNSIPVFIKLSYSDPC